MISFRLWKSGKLYFVGSGLSILPLRAWTGGVLRLREMMQKRIGDLKGATIFFATSVTNESRVGRLLDDLIVFFEYFVMSITRLLTEAGVVKARVWTSEETQPILR